MVADIVAPVPDSGNFAAQGFAHESGISYHDIFVRDHCVGRTFIAPRDRAEAVDSKLNIIKDAVRVKRVVVIDDSIVRGSGSSEVVEKLLGFGAREIHFLVSLPPIRHPCHLAISMRTAEELVANQGDVAKLIGATSVNYTTPEEFIRAYREIDIRIPEDQAEIFLDLC